MVIPAMCSLATLQAEQGQLRLAAKTYQTVLDFTTEHGGQQVPALGQAYVGLSKVMYEWNDLRAADQFAYQGLKQNKLWGNVDSLASGPLVVARLSEVRQDWQATTDATD